MTLFIAVTWLNKQNNLDKYPTNQHIHSVIHQSINNTTTEQMAIQLTGNEAVFPNLWPNTIMDTGWWNTKSRWLPLAALASYLYQLGRPQGQHCPAKSVQLISCVTSSFWSGPNSKSTKRILTRFKIPKTVDHYLFIYQKLSLLPNLSNEAKIRLTPRTLEWKWISSS